VSHYEPLRSVAAVLRRVTALVCLSGLVTGAQAQSNVAAGPLATAIANGYVFSYSPSGQPVVAPARSYISGAEAGSVIARDAVNLAQPGSGLSVQTSRTVPWGNIARGIGSAASRALPWVTGALVVCAILDQAGVECPPGAGGALMDPGTTQQTVNGFSGSGSFAANSGCGAGASGTGFGTTVPAAASDLVAKLAASRSGCTLPFTTSGGGTHNYSYTYAVNSCGASSCSIVKTTNQTTVYNSGSTVTFNPVTSSITVGFSPSSTSQCPPLTGGIVPQPWPDGTCPTDLLVEPSEQELSDAVEQRGNRTAAPDALRELVENGQPIQAPGPGVVTGPSSIVGSTTTTTTPTGTETRTTSYAFDYSPDRVTWGRVETGTDVNGNTSTTTTTGTDNAEDGPGLCELYPDILACAKLGEAPDEVVPTSTREVDFEAVDLGSSGCPGPIDLGDGKTFSYEPLCDNLETVRPLIIAVGFVMAALIIVNALRA